MKGPLLLQKFGVAVLACMFAVSLTACSGGESKPEAKACETAEVTVEEKPSSEASHTEATAETATDAHATESVSADAHATEAKTEETPADGHATETKTEEAASEKKVDCVTEEPKAEEAAAEGGHGEAPTEEEPKAEEAAAEGGHGSSSKKTKKGEETAEPVTLPAAFPAADVPLVEGELLAAQETSYKGRWMIVVASEDTPKKTIPLVKEAYTAAGYTIAQEGSIGGSENIQFVKGGFTVLVGFVEGQIQYTVKVG